ncbi:ATP-binding protein [Dehalobacterium formicoaceticum]|uniref:ATP-binding protein n=1 Tax=Dehalobacterium formicoaceticum TaxID=51515 RepID=UPI000B7C8EC2|nr:ATP-binding protein [Dehalobacterium formicoaceticum]
MTGSIVLKLWLTIVLLIIVVFIALGLGLFQAVENFYYTQIAAGLINQGQEVADMYAKNPAEFQENNEIEYVSRIMNAHLMILNKESIIQTCNQMMPMTPGSLFEENDLDRIFTGETVAKRGFHHSFNNQMLSIGLPIIQDKKIESALFIYTPIASLEPALNTIRGIIYWSLFFAVILISILAFFLSRTLSKPLIQMNKVALNLAEGDYSQRVPVKSVDEVGILGASLNFLSEQLKKNITELSYEKEQIENILKGMSDGVITFDTTGKIVLFNPQAKELLDNCVEVEKNNIMEHCDYLTQLNSLYQRTLETGNLVEGEITVNEKIVSAKLSPLLDVTDRNLIGVVTVLQDVTKDRKLEEMRRDFVANVSHELRTPISLIQGYSEAIIDDVAESPEERNGFIKVILEEANRLKRLVEDLLELSRLQSGVISIEKEWIDIREVLLQVKTKFQSLLEQNKIDFQAEIASDAPCLLADRFRLEQLLINLISNAIHFAAGKTIKVTSRKLENGIELSVSDTGQGIPEKDLPFIFERFYRAEKSRNRESGGTGIGLSIVKNIVEVHDGAITVMSKEGEGATFNIMFPSK